MSTALDTLHGNISPCSQSGDVMSHDVTTRLLAGRVCMQHVTRDTCRRRDDSTAHWCRSSGPRVPGATPSGHQAHGCKVQTSGCTATLHATAHFSQQNLTFDMKLAARRCTATTSSSETGRHIELGYVTSLATS